MRKKLILILLLSVSSSLVKAQITMLDLLFVLNSNSIDAASDRIQSKGFGFYNSSPANEKEYALIVWAKDKDKFSENANAWLELYKTDRHENVKLYFQTSTLKDFNLMESYVKGNFKATGEKIKDGAISTNYRDNKYIISLTKRNNKTNNYSAVTSTSYEVMISKSGGIEDFDNGKKITYHDNGNVKQEYTLKNGSLNGQLTQYHDNGNLKGIRNYLNNKQIGGEKVYDEKGLLKLSTTVLNDNTVKYIWYKDGNISTTYDEVNELIEGLYTEYFYKNGELAYKEFTSFKNGDKNGDYKLITIDNDTLQYGYFLNDEKHGEFKEYLKNDTIGYFTYRNDKKEGPYKLYSFIEMYEKESLKPTSTYDLSETGSYRNNFKHGKSTTLFFGEIFSEGQYDQGEKTGEWSIHHLFPPFKGEIEQTVNYKNGIEHGKSIIYLYNNPIDSLPEHEIKRTHNYERVYLESNYLDGKLEGDFIYKSGAIVVKSKYKGDKLNGDYMFYENDTLRHTTHLINNKIISKKKYSDSNQLTSEHTIYSSVTPIKVNINEFLHDNVIVSQDWILPSSFTDLSVNSNYESLLIESGEFEIYHNNKLVFEGMKKEGKVVNKLSTHYSDDVHSEKLVTNENDVEKFYNGKNELFSGELTFFNPLTNENLKFNVKKGLINGVLKVQSEGIETLFKFKNGVKLGTGN